MSIARNILVTGANRGIGLEFVKQLAKADKPPRHLFAACREPTKAEDLRALAEKHECVQPVQLDVCDDGSVASAYKLVSSMLADERRGLNLLINNAGVLDDGGNVFPDCSRQHVMKHFAVNSVGPVFVSQAFLPLLKMAATENRAGQLGVDAAIVNLSSALGSIAGTHGSAPGGIGYKMSKAALNMAVKCLGEDLNADGILCVALCPGWVQTDMSSPDADLTPKTSVLAMLNSFKKLSDEHQGRYFYRDLAEIEY